MGDSLRERFPRLAWDSAESCPCPLEDIHEYLKLEDDSGDEYNRKLKFIRTARAFDSDYWIWEYRTHDGTHCYATVTQFRNMIILGMDWGTGDLSPEEYIVSQHRRSSHTR